MSKTKIEPFTIDDIRAHIPLIVWKFVGPQFEGHNSNDMARYILAWIHAEARARKAETISLMMLDEHIAAVKKEVGWED